MFSIPLNSKTFKESKKPLHFLFGQISLFVWQVRSFKAHCCFREILELLNFCKILILNTKIFFNVTLEWINVFLFPLARPLSLDSSSSVAKLWGKDRFLELENLES